MKLKAMPAVVPLLLVTLSGCSVATAPGPSPAPPSVQPTPRVSASVPKTPSPAPVVAVEVPKHRRGEISRTVFRLHPDSGADDIPTTDTAIYDRQKGQRSFSLRAACSARSSGVTIGYRLVDASDGGGSRALSTGRISCDGSTAWEDLGALEDSPVTVDLDLGDSDVTTAYALVVPPPH
jgi:hypothetical protein